MAIVTIRIGDCKVSKDPTDILVTHALGSCIGVVFYDPVARVAGLLHYMLPNSKLDPEGASKRPSLFADTGIPLLLQSVCQLGAIRSRSVVMVAGGARMLDPEGIFNIGQQNCDALRRELRKAGVVVDSEEIGGTSSRTVQVDVSCGRVLIRTSGGPDREMLSTSRKNGAGDGLQHTLRR